MACRRVAVELAEVNSLLWEKDYNASETLSRRDWTARLDGDTLPLDAIDLGLENLATRELVCSICRAAQLLRSLQSTTTHQQP